MNKDSYHSMKRGLALSLVIHVIFLSWGAVHITTPVSLPKPLEALSITLAPLDQELSLQEGALEAPIRAIPAVKPTTKPQEQEEAHHVGEGKIDNLAPFKPKEKPRNVEATPPPPSEAENVAEKPAPLLKGQELLEEKTEEMPEIPLEEALAFLPKERLELPKEALQAEQEKPDTFVQEAAQTEQEKPDTLAQEAAQAEQEKPDTLAQEAAQAEQEKPDTLAQEAAQTGQEKPDTFVQEAAQTEQEKPDTFVQEAAQTEQEKPDTLAQEVPQTEQEKPDTFVQEVPQVEQKHRNKKVRSLQKLLPTAQKAPVEPVPVPQQEPKIVLPESSPFPQIKPKPAPKTVARKAQALHEKKQQITEQTIEDILAREEKNLLNRARTQGGGAKRSQKPEASGARKNINDIAKMAQTLVNIAGGCIQQKLKLVALGGDLKNRPVLRLRFYLNREGMVVGEPLIDPLRGAESQQAIMIRQVYAAVFACQPYTDLPRDQYDLWGQGFDFNVDPLQNITE